jgi:isopentenyl diphosphate isomerase/L-lactate dehydrogenase-like FMN-dependent dehydrogenase
VELGAQAVVVSNHGGRQLDGAASSISALPHVLDAVGDGAEVYFDGGVRRGADVLKAVALGARAVLLGRALLYGLAAGGDAGVARALAILRGELELALALAGCPAVERLDRSFLLERE